MVTEKKQLVAYNTIISEFQLQAATAIVNT